METIEFDGVYSAVTGERVRTEWAPDVMNDPSSDIAVYGDGWHALTGYTQQHGYRGAVMHPSETADDDTIREWVRDAGGDVFALVVVESPCGDGCQDAADCEEYGHTGEPAGWAAIYQDADA